MINITSVNVSDPAKVLAYAFKGKDLNDCSGEEYQDLIKIARSALEAGLRSHK